nr:SDR family NAD(P)-dependent oxidoreductase [Rhodococcus sp. 06-235-1A]
MPFADYGAYNASKWAVEGFSDALSQEVAGFGIKVTLLEPGSFSTEVGSSSAVYADPIPAYDDMRAQQQEQGGNTVSATPDGVGEALLSIVDSDDPPLRAFLGRLGVDYVPHVYSARLEQSKEWAPVAIAAGESGAAHMNTSITVVDAGGTAVSRQATIAAPAHQIFDLVADPHRRPELDGSGTVRDTPVSGPHRLSTDAVFRVGMRKYRNNYTSTLTVTEFETNQTIEWQHSLGQRWRWEFEPVTPTITRVTETWDYGDAKLPLMLKLFRWPTLNAAAIENTLRELEARFAPGPK